MENIAVIGKRGQLASELNALSATARNILCFGREDIDLSNVALIEGLFISSGITGVINASAYTAVDQAEYDIENAFALNETAVANLAYACKHLQLPLIHISTDYVFAGDKGSPYLPEDELAPTGVYGKSKAAGEQQIQAIWPTQSCILRTSWVYSFYGNNFVKTMLKLMNDRDELGIICDQIGSPTNAAGLAQACLATLENNVTGIHHCSDLGVASWYDFATAIHCIGLELGLINKPVKLHAINSNEYPTPAKRPHYSVLDKKSLQQVLPEFEMQHWQKALKSTLEKLAK